MTCPPRPAFAPAIVVRDARPADVPALAGLLAQLFAVETEFTIDSAAQEQGLSLLLGRPDSAALLVAEAGGRVAGMVSLQFLVSTAQGGTSALLEDLVVDEGFRGKGLGKRLLAAAEKRAARAGAGRIQLLADHANPAALDFYAKRGFALTRMVCLRKISS